MRDSPAAILTPAAAAVVALLLLVLWVTTVGVPPLQARIPGTDRPPEAEGEPAVALEGTLVTSDGRAADLPGEWPRFRGSNFDGIAHESVALARTWPGDGPKMLWSIELGEGHAGAAVRDGRVYVLDYDRAGGGRRLALPVAGRRGGDLAIQLSLAGSSATTACRGPCRR